MTITNSGPRRTQPTTYSGHSALRAPLALFFAIVVTAFSMVYPARISGTTGDLRAADTVFQTDSFWEKPDSLRGTDPGCYWLWKKETRISGGLRSPWLTTSTHHYQIVVFNAGSMEEHADITIPLGPRSKLTVLEARVINKDGSVVRGGPDDVFERRAVPDFMLYSDMREKVFTLPGFSDSCVVDVA